MNIPYIYCPRCASRMVEQNIGNKARPVCPACGLIVYLNPRVVAAVIPELNGKIVLVRRAMEPRSGTWVFPGGYVDMGEAVDDAARRETWEETGLRVQLERMLGVYSRDGDEVVLIAYAGQVIGGELTPGDEESEAAWFSPDALPADDQLGFWSTRLALQEWLRGRPQ